MEDFRSGHSGKFRRLKEKVELGSHTELKIGEVVLILGVSILYGAIVVPVEMQEVCCVRCGAIDWTSSVPAEEAFLSGVEKELACQ